MKKRKENKNKLEKQLLAYGVAAGTAIAMASPAGAQVKSTMGYNYVSNSSLTINIDGVGPAEFTISHSATQSFQTFTTYSGSTIHYTVSTAVAKIFAVGTGSANQVAFVPGMGPPLAQNMYNSMFVPTNVYYGWTDGAEIFHAVRNNNPYGGMSYFTGNFGPYGYGGGTGYLGIQFKPGEDVLYGWIYIDMVAPDLSELEIAGWAYEDTGAPIHVGDTGSPVPIPSSLMLLASGAAGVAALRRRKREEENVE